MISNYRSADCKIEGSKRWREKRVEINRDFYNPLLMSLSIFKGDRFIILRQKEREKRMNKRVVLRFLLDSKRKRDIKTDFSFRFPKTT